VAGEYDFFNGLEASFKDELVDANGNLREKYSKKFRFLSRTFLNTEYLGLWLEKNPDGTLNPLQDVNFRRALNYAIDRKSVIRYFKNNLGVAGNGGFLPIDLSAAKFTDELYNPEVAGKMLARAGYSGGKGCPEMRITTTSDYLDLILLIQKYWEALGLKVSIDVQSGGMIRQLRNKGVLPIWRGSWIADYTDAENYLACFSSDNFSPGGPNYTHYRSSKFDEIYSNVLTETNDDLRSNHIAAAEKLLMDEVPVIVLFYDKSVRLYQNNLQNFSNDAANRLVLKYVRKVEKQ
jgi:ABC-type transport system substrate-binding protein